MSIRLTEQETLAPVALATLQRRKLETVLRTLLAPASQNWFYRERIDPAVLSRSDLLEALPLTTRAALEREQALHPPYGRLLTESPERYTRLHQTSGSSGAPLRWLDTPASWAWFTGCWETVYRGTGVLPADRVLFAFSFGPFIGFWAAFEAAARMGNVCLPVGGLSSLARANYLREHGATVVCCTPTYALHLAQTAARAGLDLRDSAVRLLILAGEPGANIPALRAQLEEAWGASVRDHAGATEVGPWGFECGARPGGLHLNESEFIVDVLDPQTHAPAADGAVGELVLTNLGRAASPVVRYRTGDLVRLRRGRCECGRTWAWAEGGVLGRCDDLLFIRGNNVFPAAVEDILRSFAAVTEFRLSVESDGPLAELLIEFETDSAAAVVGLEESLADAVRDRLHFRPRVRAVPAGTLPRFEFKARRLVKP